MSDATLGVAAAASPTDLVDNEAVTTGSGAVKRQRVRIGGSTGSLLAEVTSGGALKVDASATTQPVSAAAPSAANVLSGYQTFTSTTGATTLITVPAGRTWQGVIGASCAVGSAAAATAAGQARAVITTAGTGVTPAAGTYFAVEAKCGANAVTGTVGSQGSNSESSPFAVIAPAGNSVTVQVTTTVAGTAGVVDAWALGSLA